MENPIFSWMIWGKPIIFGNTLISFSWNGTAPFCLEAIRDFYNVSHASLFRKHHSHHFHGNLHQHTHNSHPKRAQFSMTFPPQQKNPATWVHISTTWGLQHYQYDLYFDDAPSEMSFSPGPIGRSLETLAEAPPTRNEGAVRMKKQQTAPQLLWGASRSVVVEVVGGF